MMRLRRAREQFAGFPSAYTLMPFWFWNDDLREGEIVRQLNEFKRQHVYAAMISPMVGLIQPYLSEKYFEMYKFALCEARKRRMRLWVYDEYCWPSGTAAGKVPDLFPEYRMTAGRFYSYAVPASAPRRLRLRLPPGRVIRAWAQRDGVSGTEDIIDAVYDTVLDWKVPRGAWTANLCVVTPVQTRPESSTGARWTANVSGYTDVMNREAVSKFIELVYDAHYRAAPEYFGNTMPGFFTDEAGFLYDMLLDGGRDTAIYGFDSILDRWDTARFADNPVLRGFRRSVPWTNGLLGIFRERYGYDLRKSLPELVRGAAADRGVCYDYFRLLSDLFAENYCAQIGNWCARHDIVFTGHWCEGINRGDFHRQAAAQQAPGIDILGNESAFDKLIALPRQAASVARAYGRERVVAEIYGVTKWNYELPDKIKHADMLTVLGINAHAPIDHAYSLRSFRKHTSNPPGFFQAPAWQYQKYFSDHVARLCLATSLGRAEVNTAIFFPTEAALSNSIPDPLGNEQLACHVRSVFEQLLELQVEADFVFESALASASIADGCLFYAGAAYRTLVMPTIGMTASATVGYLSRFVEKGGNLIVYGRPPKYDPRGARLGARARALFGDSRVLRPGKTSVRDYGKGKLIILPDPAGAITTSAPVKGGKKGCLFDGTGSLVCTDKQYPQWIDIDLGKRRELLSLSITIEGAKQAIKYEYAWQVSDDARRWRSVARLARSGLVHKTCLSRRCAARYVRLYVQSGGGRMFGLQEMAIEYRDEHGASKIWQPPAVDPTCLRGLFGGGAAPLEFRETSGRLCPQLVSNTRVMGKDRLLTVMNRSSAALRLNACLAGKFRRAGLELWDADNGAITRLGHPDGEFQVPFAPYECRVFAVIARRTGGSRAAMKIMDYMRQPVFESRGPWPFQTERPNAYPLMNAGLRMADPFRPDEFQAAPDGRIPRPLRRAPYVLFECQPLLEKQPSGREELLFDEGLLTQLRINGQPLKNLPRRNRYLDAFGMSAPIGELLHRGKNTISGWFMPEIYERAMRGIFYNEDILQPTFDVYLLGDFAVSGNRLAEARKVLDNRPWQEQGYAFYSGTATYSVSLDVPKSAGFGLWLEIGSRGSLAEVRLNKRRIGVRTHPPFLFDLSGMAAAGSPMDLRIMITNTIGTMLSAQRIGTLVGVVERYTSGLEYVKLLV